MEIEGKRINPDNLTSSKIKAFTDEKITRYIVNGVPDEGMPAFKDKLNEAQIAEIVEFVRSDIQKQSPGESSSSNQSR
jgi:mono/diheme cytochrome c family protein